MNNTQLSDYDMLIIFHCQRFLGIQMSQYISPFLVSFDMVIFSS